MYPQVVSISVFFSDMLYTAIFFSQKEREAFIVSFITQFVHTYLFKKNGTLYFSNKIKTVNHIRLMLSGIHIHPWPHVFCKFGNDIQRNSHSNDSSKRYKIRLTMKKVHSHTLECIVTLPIFHGYLGENGYIIKGNYSIVSYNTSI